MVNTLALYMPVLKGIMKLVGMTTQAIEIEPGTVMNFWVPTQITTKNTRAHKPSVVFLHCFGFNGILTWQFQVMSLAKNYAVYVPDFLFFGDSVTNRNKRSPAFQADCVVKGLTKLGVDHCTLVGSSYGGMVAFKIAEMKPDLVESMVVTGSVMALTESVSQAGLERVGFSSWADFLMPSSVQGLKETLRIATYKLPWIPDFVYRDFLKEIQLGFLNRVCFKILGLNEGGQMMTEQRKERTELLEALVVSDKDFSISRFPKRIHLLWGERDNIFDVDVARHMKEQLEGRAILHTIERAGHLVHLERPCAYNRHLKKLLASLYEEEGKHK